MLQCACVWAVLGRWCSVQSVRCASVDDRRNHQKIQISRAPAFPHNCALAGTRLCPTRGRGYARSRRAATGLGWLAPIPKASRWARLGLQGRLGSSREALARVVSLPHLGRAGLSRRAWLRSRSLRCRWSALCNWPAGFGGLPLRRCSGGASHVRLALRGVRGGGGGDSPVNNAIAQTLGQATPGAVTTGRRPLKRSVKKPTPARGFRATVNQACLEASPPPGTSCIHMAPEEAVRRRLKWPRQVLLRVVIDGVCGVLC